MEIIDGKKISEEIKKELAYSDELDAAMVDIWFKGDLATEKFVGRKKKFANDIRVMFRELVLENGTLTDDLVRVIKETSNDPSVGAIVLQLPLPEGIDREKVIKAIPRDKDVDALRSVYENDSLILPPAVETVKEILKRLRLETRGMRVAILGAKGFLIGQPVADYLKDKVKELILIDKGDDLSLVRDADLVISGVGKPGLFKASELRSGAGVIDFGTGLNAENKLAGDMLLDKTDHLGFYTPTPGGTGPILVAKLFENFFKLLG